MANITWTTEQVEFLTREYYNYTKEELAKMLGKSKAAVVTKHNKMLKGERTTGNKKTRVYLELEGRE